jgi:hypothetical protein
MQELPLIIKAPSSGFKPGMRPTVSPAFWQSQLNEAMYNEDSFCLLRRNLADFSHILSSREGLYAVGLHGFTKIADGQFFGITIDREEIYCFEAVGPIPSLWPHRGRILRLSLEKKNIVSVMVVVKGLPNGCHQIDLVESDLYVCDTYNSRLFKINLDSRTYTSFLPWGDIGFQDFAAGYPHMNSVVGFEGTIYLMLHHCSQRSGRRSQMVEWLPDKATLGATKTLVGRSCHNIVFLEDKSLVVCDSDAGALSDGEQCIIKLGQMFTRGLSIDSEFVVVGSSWFSRRDSRGIVAGEVCFLDRKYREIARFVLPAAATDIRRIDGRDLSLTHSHPPWSKVA